MKIQTKISLLFACLVTGIILVISFAIYYFTNQNSYEDFYKRLEIRAVIAAKASLEKDETNVSAFDEIRREHLERLPFEKEYFIPVDSINQASNIISLPASFYSDIIAKNSARHQEDRIFYAGILYEDNQGNFIVIVSARNELNEQLIAGLRNTLAIMLIAGIILSFATGIFFSRKMLEPVRKITGTVKDISAHNLHKRLNVKEGEDEIAGLSSTFNDMLDRLETAFETQNNFVSHASHELNTPLTAIIGEAEYALHKPRNPEQYTQSINTIRQSAERLHNITKSLLHLAQTGLTDKTQSEGQIRIDELIFEVKKTVDNIEPDNKIVINMSLMPEDPSKLSVQGNNQLLELAIANIVLNACKYSGNKPVQVALAATNNKAIIMVKDEGIGIPSEEVKYIFEPFFRASNTMKYKGYGIGLPLARNIIRMHKGEITVRSTEAIGTEISIQLPLSQ